MARSIVIWTDTIEADFRKADPFRLAFQFKEFYTGSVYINPESMPLEEFIEIQICEILETTKTIHAIKIKKTCPVIFHYTEGDFKYLKNYQQLDAIGTLLHSDYYSACGKYFPYWAYDYKHRVQFYNQKLNSYNSFVKKFLCFNGRPDVHRWYILQKLYDEKLLDSGFVSFLNRYNQIENQISFDKFQTLYSGDIDYAKSIFLNKKLLILDKSNEQIHDNDRTHEDFLYTDTSISLITETYGDSRPGCFITEKSWKAIANCHIPIWIAQKGIVSAFKSMGYDVFDDIIDQNYDRISKSEDRWNTAIKSLKIYLSTDINFKNNIMERLLNNQKKFLELTIDDSIVTEWI